MANIFLLLIARVCCFPTPENATQFAAEVREKAMQLPGLKLKCIEENEEEDQVGDERFNVKTLSGKTFDIAKDHGLRYLKESLLPEEDLQTVSCPFHLPVTNETWECIDIVSQKVKEYHAMSSAVLVRSFELGMWLRFAKQRFRKTPPKARKFHSFIKFMKSKGIAKTTGYKMIKFASFAVCCARKISVSPLRVN